MKRRKYKKIRLRTANLTHPVELEVMQRFIKKFNLKKGLEFGSKVGWSTSWIADELENNDGSLVTVDIIQYPEFIDNIKLSEVNPIQIIGHSGTESIKKEIAKYGPFDFVFIDGGHIYTEVKSDLDLAISLADEMCMIFLHDIELDREDRQMGVIKVFEDYPGFKLTFKEPNFCSATRRVSSCPSRFFLLFQNSIHQLLAI